MDKTLFRSAAHRAPPTDTVNDAGGEAYALSPEQALAQVAATGCFRSTFYADERVQLDRVLSLAMQVEPRFLAQVAVYSRQAGLLKDMPAFLVSVLAQRDAALARKVFERTIDTGKMVRNVVQAIRSGVCDKPATGAAPAIPRPVRHALRAWLNGASDWDLMRGAIGGGETVSLADVVRMVHPKPTTDERRAFFGWLIGREVDTFKLPPKLAAFVAWKLARANGEPTAVPDVPLEMLEGETLTDAEWATVVPRLSWMQTLKNMNRLVRHGVGKDDGLRRLVADKLRNPDLVARSRCYPYQVQQAYLQTRGEVPVEWTDALHDAMEHATANVPEWAGDVVVAVDVSGSMRNAVTGHARKGHTSKTQCLDVAALLAASLLRRNRRAEVLTFSDRLDRMALEPRDTIATNYQRIAAAPSGGTACWLPIAWLNRENRRPDLVVIVSDNESWVQMGRSVSGTSYARNLVEPGTDLAMQWLLLKRRAPNAKLVLLDLVPNTTTQAQDRADVLNVGGFSDRVWDVVKAFTAGAGSWLDAIKSIEV